MIQAAASVGRRPSSSATLVNSTAPDGSSIDSAPKFTTHAKPLPAGEGDHIVGPFQPLELIAVQLGELVANPQRVAVEPQHRGVVTLLRLGRQRRPVLRLRQPWLAVAEAERRSGACPRQRDAAAVAAATGVPRPLPHRIGELVFGDVVDLRQAELLALVEVDRARQRQLEEDRGACTTCAQREVDRVVRIVRAVDAPSGRGRSA